MTQPYTRDSNIQLGSDKLFESSGGDPIVDAVPAQTWLDGYMKFTSNCEASQRFRLCCGLLVLSAIVLRNLHLQVGSDMLYPNIWMMLLGPPGCKKDTALRQARRFLDAVDKRPKIISATITPEALSKSLAHTTTTVDGTEVKKEHDACGVIYSPEAAVFLSKHKYKEGMIPMLNDLFECPEYWATETIGRGVVPLHNTCLTMMLGTTPESFRTEMPMEVHSGGFLSRTLFAIYPGEEVRYSIPPPPRKSLQRGLVRYLNKIAQLKGEIKWNRNAFKFYDEWYHSRDLEEQTLPGYFARKPGHILKISMLIMLSESPNITLHTRHIQTAMTIVDCLEETSTGELNSLALPPEMQRMYVVMRPLSKPKYARGIERNRLVQLTYRKLPGKREEFDSIIEWLCEAQQIERFIEDGKTFYKLKDHKGVP